MMNQASSASAAFRKWLPLAVTTILVFGFAYVAVQQNYRTNANDPQIQIAEDVAAAISSGNAAPEAIVSSNPTADMTASLSPFLIVYTATGTPVGSSVALDGKLPTVPSGVLDAAKKASGDYRVTWQPKPGLRIAAVVVKYGGANPGYVLAGRSLKEVESRINKLTMMGAVALLVTLILSYIVTLMVCKKPEIAAVSPSQPVETH